MQNLQEKKVTYVKKLSDKFSKIWLLFGTRFNATISPFSFSNRQFFTRCFFSHTLVSTTRESMAKFSLNVNIFTITSRSFKSP